MSCFGGGVGGGVGGAGFVGVGVGVGVADGVYVSFVDVVVVAVVFVVVLVAVGRDEIASSLNNTPWSGISTKFVEISLTYKPYTDRTLEQP